MGFAQKNGRDVLCCANSFMIEVFSVDYQAALDGCTRHRDAKVPFFPQKPWEIVGVWLLDSKTSQSSPVLLIVKLVGVW